MKGTKVPRHYPCILLLNHPTSFPGEPLTPLCGKNIWKLSTSTSGVWRPMNGDSRESTGFLVLG